MKSLLDTIGSLKVCQGYPFSRYKPLYKTHKTLQSLFQTKEGTQPASVNICMFRNKEEIIRSSKYIFLLWADESISTPDTCEACKSINHYLRTKLSRLNNKKENVDPAKVGCDYMSKNDLLEMARLSVKKMKYWRLKCKRLDEYRQKMTTVGQNTHQDFSHKLFRINPGIKYFRVFVSQRGKPFFQPNFPYAASFVLLHSITACFESLNKCRYN